MLTAMGPEYAKYLWWKKYITTLQLVSNFFCISYVYNLNNKKIVLFRKQNS